MRTARWDDDDGLLGELRAAVRRAGTATPGMAAAADAAFAWRDVDAELAVLSAEAAVAESALVRGTSTAPRTLDSRRASTSRCRSARTPTRCRRVPAWRAESS